MFEHTSDLIFLIGFAIYIVTRGVFEHRTRGVQRFDRQLDMTETVILGFVLLGCVLLPPVYLFSPWLDFANSDPPVWAQWIGGGLLIGGLGLFYKSHVDLGKNWSGLLEMRTDHELVTRGVYRRIRHPMYLAILMISASQALLLHNWLAGDAALVAFIPLYLYRVPREERMMRDRFGAAYSDYARRTGRLMPRLFPLIDAPSE